MIIGIGRLTRQKNFLLLIRAFKKILIKYPNYRLILLGEGEQEKFLIKEIIKLELQDKISLLGYQKNVYKYLLNSDCFILTSLWEDPGFVLIEAALANTLIISSNCPNGPNEILSNGQNGFLFKNNNTNSLAEHLNSIIEMDKSKLQSIGNEGRKNVLKKFDVEKMCHSTFVEYQKLISYKK